MNAKEQINLRSRCKKGEKLLSAIALNQAIRTSQDAAGPSGIQGEPGIMGIAGEAGPQGQQGPPGPAGIIKGPSGELNLAACRVTSTNVQGTYDSNAFNPSNPVLYAEALCNPATEFLLEDESKVNLFNAGTKVALQARSPFTQNIGGDVKEYGVGVYTNRVLAVGSGIFELSVRAVCCPR